MTHPWGIAGLVANTLGAFGLLRFTSNPDANATLTHEHLQSLRLVMPESRRSYRFEINGYRISIGALALGFILQLIDLCVA